MAQGVLASDFVRYSVSKTASEYVELIEAKDAVGKWHVVAASPTNPRVVALNHGDSADALIEESSGPYSSPPSLHFTEMSATANAVELHGQIGRHAIAKLVRLTPDGKRIIVFLADDISGEQPKLKQFLSLYAFIPDGRAMSSTGRPDSTFAPQMRPGANDVIGDHIFRSPFVTAQKGSIALSVIPDLEILNRRRAMPTVLELDCKNGVVDAPLLGFGFYNYELTGHVRFSRKPTARAVDKTLRLGYFLEPTALAQPNAAFQSPVSFLWERFGHTLFAKTLPQVMPWDEYARVCYPAAMHEALGDNKLGWFEHRIDKYVCGGIYAGWGYDQGLVHWQCWFNNLRSAWGLRYFGERQQNKEWIERANKMLNLALAARSKNGAFPTTYNGKTKQWTGCMMRPEANYYYDLPSMAWKGIWLIEWLPFGERTDDIRKTCGQLADFFVSHQHSDGSYPSWLTEDFKEGKYLSHTAQSALPAWFLAQWNQVHPDARFASSARKACDFLIREVIPQQKYYDFETFFSCSPKQCSTDDEAMRDPHTLAPPQNTLCMQWSAEALRLMYEQTGDGMYKQFGKMALDMMNTFQDVWSPSFITSAYAFGGYGVQNSDGEHLDARQAQFGATNFAWGVLLDDQELCERGVAATRAAMTLINHPLHEANMLYPFPNYPLGLQPENVAHGGFDHQAGRTGFDWGEGSGLASAAYLLNRFGNMYATKDWAVGIEAVQPKLTGKQFVALNGLALNAGPWNAPIANTERADGIKITGLRALQNGMVECSASVFVHDPSTWSVGKREVSIVKSGKYKLQFEPAIDVVMKLGAIERKLSFAVDPRWDFEDGLQGWTYAGSLPLKTTSSSRYDFHKQGRSFIGTCEDGLGGFDDSYTAVYESPMFVARKLRMLVGGGAGDKTYVALVDTSNGQELLKVHGKNSEEMLEVEWDLTPYLGKPLQIRIVDRAGGGWGHINVDDIDARAK